jgi:hypothetical protein
MSLLYQHSFVFSIQVIVDRERQPQVAVARNLSEIMPKIKESAQKSKEYVRKQMEMYDGPSTAATNGSTSNETMSSSRSRFVPDDEWCQAKVSWLNRESIRS